MKGNQKRVLVTAIGTMNCTTIIGELKKSGKDFYIIGSDINNQRNIANSIEVDEFYQFPPVLEDRTRYVNFVKSFCKEHLVDYLYCVVDEEVEAIAKERGEFEKIGVKLCLANTDAIIICHNKNVFAQWSEKEMPQYCIRRFANFEDISENDLPVFIKPIEGRASIGCKQIQSKEELFHYKRKWDQFVVEEFLTGEIVAVDIVRNKVTNQFEISQRLELLRNSSGCGVAVEIVDLPQVREACRIIADKLDLNGVINAEFFITDEGPKIIEINPRLPAGIAYSCMSGLDVVMNAMRIANGEPCKFSSIKIGAHYAKRYETYET